MKSLKAVFSFLLIALMTLGTARAGQVTGTFATPGGSFIQNATITFTLSQLAVKTDASQTVAPSTVSCYTSVDGSLVGLPNPQASPVLAATSGSMTAGTYYEVITYWNASGETLASPEQTVVLSSSQGIQTSSPGLQPAGASGYKIYVGIAPGGEVLQATVTGFATTSIGSLIGGSSPPISNSTPCNIAFNDTFIPAYTTYRVSALDSTGSPLPGFPQSFYLQGSTVNLNTMLPASGLSARFPQPIVASPINTTTQSINSNLSLNGHDLLGVKSVNSVIDLAGSGCKGDGVTDDRVCISAVLATAGSLSGAVTVCVTDNHTFLLGSNPNAGAVGNVIFTMPTNVNFACKGTIKVGNSFGNYFALFNWSSPPGNQTFRDFTIDENAVNNVITLDPNAVGQVNTNSRIDFDHFVSGGGPLVFENITFINGDDTWTITGETDKTIIRNNKWVHYGLGTSVDYDHSELYEVGQDAQVMGNTFECVGTGCRTAIEVHRNNKMVKNNIIRGFRIGVIASSDTSPAACTGTARNFNISGNTIDQAYNGVQLWAGDGQLSDVQVTDNVINLNRNGPWTPDGTESGVLWVTTSPVACAINNLHVDNNTIKWDADTATYTLTNGYNGGINFPSSIAGQVLNGGTIVGNYIANPPTVGMYINLHDGVKGLTVSDNTIVNPGQQSNAINDFKSGILAGSGPGLLNYGWAIKNNNIIDTQVTPTMQRGIEWAGVAGDNSAAQMRIEKNVINYLSGSPNKYYLIQVTSPFLDITQPGFSTATTSTLFNSLSSFPPLGSKIFDSTQGTTWVQNSASALSFSPLAQIVGTASLISQTASIGTTTLYTIPTNYDGMYRLHYYLVVQQAATTSSAIQATFTYANGLGTPSHTSTNLTGNVVGTTEEGGTFIFRGSVTGTITYATTYSSTGATAMQYRLFVRLEYLGSN